MRETDSPAKSDHKDDDDLLEFLDGPEIGDAGDHASSQPWRVLIVDDDGDVHKATELAMQGLLVEGLPLTFLHANSAAEARQVLTSESDLAVVLLDVVMESEDAGLQLVRYIRDDLRLGAVRIILRTGQPGYAPEIETVQAYDINDYKTKSELTRTRLYTVLTAAIRSYRQICSLDSNRRGLEMIVEASTELSRLRGLHRFAEGVVTQLCAMLGILPEGMVCVQMENAAEADVRIVAAAGQYSGLINCSLASVQIKSVRERLQRCLNQRENIYDEGTCLYFSLSNGRPMAALVDVGRRLSDLDQQLLRAFCSNISVGFENVVLYGKLLDQAYNDQLLQLPNRNRFVELLDKNLKDPAGVTLALIDLDDFSDINDAFGHHFGDQVLKAVVARLGSKLGLSTAMARIGSDTFGLLGENAVVCGETIQDVFLEPFSVAGERLQLSATTGLVRLTESAAVGSELLLDAQIALKQAKQQHRGSSEYFSPAMGTDARERFKLLKGLRAGFEENRLFVVYQPQVDLLSGKPIGAEALLRWRTEDGKFVPPDQFIPLAEKSGLIISIGEFVLRTACHQLKHMIELGYADFRMCVNVSLAQFRHPDFMTVVNNAMRDIGVAGRNLELEITESMAMEDTELVMHILANIKKLGITVAIDDFGTGFSSLSHLRQLDVDRLKIDRAFVREAQTSTAGSTIAQMVINLGRGLGLTVIAEGIETEEQRSLLLDLGCHEGQGYLFARPMPADQLENWMSQTKAGAE
ncbi:EAL domain-containing protein [Paucibacter sp. TC2R-5]|uniref:GGDEF/EAL domain-containing response regulator n=1 Tax=Paucibacter sp. TC2R-5 TaxID=2893555 RepID=UPI0021E511B5|nr:EAL domain-containing protein [Paucibacter sp. TC2R-5]MCV2360474.1 EAL domain-containing protein [Paucibacter sp. TC2R-5]